MSRSHLLAVLILPAAVGAIAGCAPERPTCSAQDADCLIKQYGYDTSRMPPTFQSAYSMAKTVPFAKTASSMKSSDLKLDDPAMAHLLDAYFQADPHICTDADFVATLSSARSRIIANGLGDAIALVESIHC